MLNDSKRNFLFQATSIITFSFAIGVSKVMAEWQEALFTHKELNEVLNSLTNDNTPTESNKITIKAPEIAENGAVVPVTVHTSINDVTNISIIVDNNPSPLTSSFDINPQLEAFVSTRVKMAESSNIIALVSTKDNQYFTAYKSIKVTIGGCGG